MKIARMNAALESPRVLNRPRPSDIIGGLSLIN
jgi:hypothetical protein